MDRALQLLLLSLSVFFSCEDWKTRSVRRHAVLDCWRLWRIAASKMLKARVEDADIYGRFIAPAAEV